jgi:hypothetical protein
VNQLVAAIPHGIPDSAVEDRLAGSIADRNAAFQTIRAKIHSRPGPEDLAAVEGFIAHQKPRIRNLQERRIYCASGMRASGRVAPIRKAGRDTGRRAQSLRFALGRRMRRPLGRADARNLRRETRPAMAKPSSTCSTSTQCAGAGFPRGRKAEPATRRQQLAALHYLRYATGRALLPCASWTRCNRKSTR